MYVPNWTARERPTGRTLTGRYIRLETLDPSLHGDDLWRNPQGPEADPNQWDYFLEAPFLERRSFDKYLKCRVERDDLVTYSVISLASGEAEGLISYCGIVPEHGMISVS